MYQAIEAGSPDQVLHLGDYVRDFHQLQRRFPQIPMAHVAGNCDYGDTTPISQALDLNGVKIFMTHGHAYRVKYTYLPAIYAALEQSAQILLFGHTHRAECFQENGLWVMNPGAAKDGFYGVIELQADTLSLYLKKQD